MRKQLVKYKDRIVGEIDGVTFRKTVRRSRHFFRKYGGYGIQSEILGDLLERGIRHIEITEKDTGTQYTATLKQYLTLGVPVDAGHGAQVVLSTMYCTRVESPQIEQLAMF